MAITNSVPKPLRLKMCGWYSPGYLFRSSIRVFVSRLFGRHADQRLVEAFAARDAQEPYYDYTCHYDDAGLPDPKRARRSLWMDYVADVGDGWNSTYAIARLLAEPQRTLRYTDPATRQERNAETRRGDVLIFGGDAVYPAAGRKEYQQRLVLPYETALRATGGENPHVFAIPGNHDWYDSLVAFTRLFTAHAWFAGWRTRQSRSYFALKLPHNWWLLGTDVQLGSDIDAPQLEYFETLLDPMNAETERTGMPARIILCHAEPHWILARAYGHLDPEYNESNLHLLEKRLGRKVAVFIAGDLHHYRRHEADDGATQKITAGGGGAFLHPTHPGRFGTKLDLLVEEDEGEKRTFREKCSFPTAQVSRRLAWYNLVFPYLPGNASWTVGFLTASLYLLLTLSVIGRMDEPVLRELQYGPNALGAAAVQTVLGSPLTALLVILTMAGFLMFTDTHSTKYRLIMGSLHGLAHVKAAFVLALIVVSFLSGRAAAAWQFVVPWGGIDFAVDTRLGLAALMIAAAGFVAGPFIVGIYLLMSLNIFGRHANEAFSSLANQDWKHFLRLHIDEAGSLAIFPIGIERVPRHWTNEETPAPDDPKATEPELIEPPIELRLAATGSRAITVSR